MIDIEDLLQFVERRAPGFGARIQPADPDCVDELAARAAFRLPPLFLGYLRVMGAGASDLELPYREMNCYAVTDHLDQRVTYSRRRFTLFALHEAPPGQDTRHYYFDAQQSVDPGVDYAVVSFEDVGKPIADDLVERAYDSFYELLLFWVTERFSLPRFACGAQLQVDCFVGAEGGGRVDRLAHARQIAGQMGFSTPLPASRLCWFGERADAALRIVQHARSDTTTFFIEAKTNNDAAGLRLLQIFRDHLELPDA